MACAVSSCKIYSTERGRISVNHPENAIALASVEIPNIPILFKDVL